ncbi:microtubule binding protein [Auriculariales sp. MPI-PUGE-AT-0066]|nr:microtubule binding protein [Auriculariales sp. MPI-PUGE-AT-0066]
MSRFVRASKYRHVFGQPGKKEYAVDNVKISNSAWDTNMLATSGRYISINWNSGGGGAFAILPLPSPFKALPNNLPWKLPDIIPLARGHSAPVLDTAWSPFDDSLVASGGEDGNILIWKVENSQFDGWGLEKWEPVDFEPVARIAASPKRIGQLLFHPAASHVLASATGDHTVKLWDLERADDPRITLSGHGDTIQSMDWNWAGTLLVTTSRDRKIRIFDPRASPEAVRVGEGHAGIKSARAVWLGQTDRIATTGFSRQSDRELSIWDAGTLESLRKVTVDQSAGVLMPFWSDNNVLFVAGKGDGNIRYYEYENDNFIALSEYKSTDPQRGLCFLPRRALSVSDCEIARAYKVSGSVVEPIAFVVPRKADSFQADIFPPALAAEPSLSAAEFYNGKQAAPNMVSLETGAVAPSSMSFAPTPKSSLAPQSTPTPATSSAYAPAPAPAPAPTPAPDPAPTTSPTPARKESLPTSTYAPARSPDAGSGVLKEENSRLTEELRDARAQIRALELQVETMRANAERASKLLGGNL